MFVKPKIKDPVKFLWGLAPSKKEAVELVRKARREMMERASREAKREPISTPTSLSIR